MISKRNGKQPPVVVVGANSLVLRPDEVGPLCDALRRLDQDGAWTRAEMSANFKQPTLLYTSNLVQAIPTEIGELTILMPDGLRQAFGSASRPRSPARDGSRTVFSVTRQLNKAYVRLGIQAMGWKLSEQQEELTRYDVTGRMIAVICPEGPALVTGALGNGYSWAGMQKIVTRLQSTALFRNFDVVLFSPTGRGKRLVEQNSAFLRQVTPPLDVGGRKRLQVTTGWAEKKPPGGPIRTNDARQILELLNQKGHEYGMAWTNILRRPRAERVHHARQDLAFDGVMTTEQLRRRYGLKPEDLEGCPHISVALRPVHSQETNLIQTLFFLHQARHKTVHVSALSHRAHVAEMRFQLDVPADATLWSYRPEFKHGRHKPDAVWFSPEGEVAIEYDTGSYVTSLIEDKVASYRSQGYMDIVWGVASPKRQARLRRMPLEQGSVRVMLARWD